VLAALLALAVSGCGAQSTPAADNSPSPAQASGGSAAASGAASNASSRNHVILPSGKVVTEAQADAGPQVIAQLMNEKQVYECPRCGLDFDRAGECTMDGSALVLTKVDYICPADNAPVDAAGRCPRCAMNARITKTAMANTTPPAPTRK
jgi:hypothetical protein